ncbi:MAG: AsmA-like C-terminal region-containing protein, partial [Pseudomonadota bacterium]
FDPGRQDRKPNRNEPGVDVTAKIQRVNGARGNFLSGVDLRLSKRSGQLQSLLLSARLNDRAVAEVGVQRARRRSGQSYRRLVLRSNDAGSALSLMDFYTNARGGRLRVDVDLDAVGPADKRGLVTVENFRVIGDPTLSQVISTSANTRRPAIAQANRAVRPQAYQEALDFDQLRVPFAIGHGQLVIFDAELRGPNLGGTLRGKVDLRRKTLDLGGTYSLLQGLNAMPRYVPALGPLLTGTRGEGLLGLTFAIQGPTSRPEVIPNPLSIVAPGIIREFFQMAPLQPEVVPRGPAASGAARARRLNGRGSRRGSATRRGSERRSGVTQNRAPKIIGGWSSETTSTPTIEPFDPSKIFDND